MSSNEDATPPGDGDNNPPSAFLKGQSRNRKRRARGHLQVPNTASQAASSDSGLAEPGPDASREPDAELTPRPAPQPVQEPAPDSARELEPKPDTELESTDDFMRGPIPRPHDDLLQGLDPASDRRTSDGPRLTQNNTQNNTQNTYNVTYNQNTYGSTTGSSSGGRGGGGRWGGGRIPPCPPLCCGPLLIAIIVSVLIVALAAAYGAWAAWNNTISVVQHIFSTVASFMTFGHLASGPAEPPRVTIVTSTSQPTPTLTLAPSLIPHAASGIPRAFEDMDQWMRKLKVHPDIETQLDENQIVFTGYAGFEGVAFEGVGSIRDMWTILSEDINRVEKDLLGFFGPLDNDISLLIRDLESRVATRRCQQELATSIWNRILSYITLSRPRSSIDIVRDNLALAKDICIRAGNAREAFPKPIYKSISHRLGLLGEAACKLRDSIEIPGRQIPRDQDLGKGVAAVVHRSNVLCSLFRDTERRLSTIDGFVDKLGQLDQTNVDLERQVAVLEALEPKMVTTVRRVEDEMTLWVGIIAEPVAKLFRWDLEG